MTNLTDENRHAAVQAIAGLATRFRNEFLDEALRRGDPKRNWLEAFLFFLKDVYPQGRNDKLSLEFYRGAERVLRERFPHDDAQALLAAFEDSLNRGLIPSQPNWWKDQSFQSPLLRELRDAKAGKRTDVQMVVDTLRFIRGLPDHNLVEFSVGEITAGRLFEHWSQLKTIRSVGPKTASLYLRDLCLIYSLAPEPSLLVTILPIDTWVRKVCESLGVVVPKERDSSVRDKIVQICADAAVSPAEFNCGAWYLGVNSFPLALEMLSSVK